MNPSASWPVHGAERHGEDVSFRVWAPDAGGVAVVVGAPTDGEPRRWALSAAGDGWWTASVPAAELPDPLDYAFAVDGGPPRPDPRSAHQPWGVHGPSRLVDHRSYVWGDAGWSAPPLGSAVIYELHLGTFTPEGTATAAIDKLDHLVDVGVTHVELLPVATFAGRHGWGYDGVDLFAPHPAYGTPDDLRALVDACHERSLAVLLDVVYNHLGPEGNYLPTFGPYFTSDVVTPWGDAVNLDGPGSDEVRRFFLDNARHWFEHYHVDGLRLDAVHALVDRSAYPFLEELADQTRSLANHLRRNLVLVAEDDRNDARLLRSPEAGGAGLDAAWVDDVHHAIHAALTGERQGYYAGYGGLERLAEALRHGYVYRGTHAVHRGRRHGRPPGPLDGTRFVVCSQNHDQVGNRPSGERLHHLAGRDAAKVAAALVCLSPFVPLLFQGEEWAASSPFPYFADHEDPALVAAVRRGRLEEFAAFDWDEAAVADPEDEATFRRAVLDWTERAAPEHDEVVGWYGALLALRRAYPELTDGRRDLVEVEVDEATGSLRMRRGRVILVATVSDRAASVAPLGHGGGAVGAGGAATDAVVVDDVGGDGAGGAGGERRQEGAGCWRLVLASSEAVSRVGDVLSLPGRSAAVAVLDTTNR